MDEYYCTKCNAILNNQPGFDPDLGVWTCTECGQTLYGDEIEDTMVLFPDGVWYCDSCGAVLSLQPGFSDDCGTWECTKCGYMNPINENELYESEEDYQRNKHIYECPYCGRSLNDQTEFKNTDTYTCEWCDTKLYKDGIDYKILYSCPNCGAALNEQWLFSEDDEWKCEECDTQLIKDGNVYICSNDTNYEDYEEEHENDEDDYGDEYEAVTTVYSSSETTYNKPNRFLSKVKKVLSFILALAIIAGVVYYEYTLLIPVGYSDGNLKEEDYEDVVDKLKERGFAFVFTKEIPDLRMHYISSEYKVTDIKIAWISTFGKDTYVPSIFPVIVTYHTLKRIPVPMSSKEATGSNYVEVVKAFEDSGFIDVEVVAKKDIITGWLTKDGEVDSVLIGNTKKFSSDDEFKPNEKVIITYHTFRKSKDDVN